MKEYSEIIKKWLKEADEVSDMEVWKWMRSLIKPLGEDGISSDYSKSMMNSEFYNIAPK